MNPYDQYGNSDSYYDQGSGVASIGYGRPQRRLVAIRNGQQIFDDDIDAPFETASATNARNDARQMAHNNAAADQIWGARQNQGMDQPDPRQQIFQTLQQKYKQKAEPSFSRMGDEFSINGAPVTSHLTQDAQAAGLDPDTYVQNKFGEAKVAAQAAMRNRMTGDFQIGASRSKLFNDPQFMGLDRESQNHLFNEVEGYGLDEGLIADKLGGNMTLAGLHNRQAIPERQSGAFKYFGGIEQATGANAFDILGNYDDHTETATIPGKPVKDPDTGETIQGPPRAVKVPRAIVEQMRQQQAYLSGFGSPHEMQSAYPSPEDELAQLEQMRAKAMALGNQAKTASRWAANPIGQFAEQLPQMADRGRAEQMLAETQRGRRQNAAAAAAKRMAEEASRRRNDAELMQEFQPAQPQQPMFLGRFGGY